MKPEVSFKPMPTRPKCPLFINDAEMSILCKSFMPDSIAVTMEYPNRITKENQEKIFCYENYKSCECFLAYLHFNWEDV